MPRVTFKKRFGKYRTGDAASLSRATARVLTASGHATPYIEKQRSKPAQSVPVQKAAPVVEAVPTVHEEVPHHAHHEAAAETAIPSVKAPKAAPAKGAGQKVDK